jgi:hypothetical protein
MEALLQNVLKFPRMPPRVHSKHCKGHLTADIPAMTHLLVNLEAMLGRELTLHMIRRQPYILNQQFEAVKARHDEIQHWLGLRPSDMILLLKKNPSFLCADPEFFKANFTALKRLLPFTPEQFLALVRKYPPILNWRTEVVKRKLDYLRSLCCTREVWQENLDYITPSLLAFFFKDSVDLTRRLEFLVVTGLAPKLQLRDVFKPSNNLFARKYLGFRAWRKRVEDEARKTNTAVPPIV